MEKLINSVDELYEFIDQNNAGNFTSIKFGDALTTLSIKYKGDNYNSSLTASAMEGIVDLQRALYKAGAQALYGVDSAAHLTQNDKEMLLLTFAINAGCTDISAKIDKLLEKIGEGFMTMESKHRLIAICIVTALLVAGYSASSIVGENTKVHLEQEKTKQMELMLKSHASLGKVRENIDIGFRQVIQGASDADEISIAKITFDKVAIASLSERAKRKPTSAEIIESSFKINSINTASADFLKFALKNQSNGIEFQATLESGSFEADEKTRLWMAASNNQQINLTISASRSSTGIKAASIEYVGDLIQLS